MAQIVKVSRRGRLREPFRVQPGGADCAVTAAVSANKARLTFTAPVVVKGVPPVTVNGVLPTGCAVVSDKVIDLTYAVNVAAGQAYVVPARCNGVRTLSGGFVARAAGTF